MRQFILYFILFLFFSFVKKVNAQYQGNGQNVKVVPSSPISSAMERYGDYPVSLSTGVPEINIPIYEIVSGDLRLPISISYHASGIKMTDFSYPVGLGWSLNAGGRISRTIRDKPDEKYPNIISYIQNPGGLTPEEAMNGMDTQPDVFYYSSGLKDGASGRFMFNGNSTVLGQIVLPQPLFFPHQNFKLDYANSAMDLIDDQGRRFHYGEATEQASPYQGLAHISAWMLADIIPASKQTSDKISFSYIDGPTLVTHSTEGHLRIIDSVCHVSSTMSDPYNNLWDSILGIQQTTSPNDIYRRIDDQGNKPAYLSNFIDPYSSGQPGSNTWYGNVSTFYADEYSSYTTKNVSDIYFKNGHVHFSYTTGQLLDMITVFDGSNQVIKKAKFNYSFFASPGNNEDRYKLDDLIITGADDLMPQKYTFEYNEGIGSLRDLNAKDFWGYYNGVHNSSPIPKWTGVPVLALCRWDSNGNPDHIFTTTDIGSAWAWSNDDAMKKYMIKKIIYPTGGYTEFEFEANKYWNTATSELTSVGGLRVKNIKSYDGVNAPLIKTYIYGTSTGDGAGIPHNIPTLEDYVIEHQSYHDVVVCSTPYAQHCWALSPIQSRIRDFLSSPNKEINFIDGNPVWYTYVEEKQTDLNGTSLGKTVYKYSLPYTDDEVNYNVNGHEIATKYKQVSRGFNLPTLQEESIYKSQGNSFELVQSSEYEYQAGYKGMVYGYPFFVGQYYNYGFSVSQLQSELLGYNPEAFKIVLQESSEIFNFTYKPIRETIKSYNGPNVVATSDYYSYDDQLYVSLHIQSTNKGFTHTYSKYPLNYSNLTGTDPLTAGVRNLQINNVISVPIEEVVKVKDKIPFSQESVVSAKLYTYKTDQTLLDKVSAIEIKQPILNFDPSAVNNGSITFDQRYHERFSFDRYNIEGDLLASHPNKYGPITSYLWGYNNQYPVAKISNMSYETVVATLGGQAAVDNFTNQATPTVSQVNAFLAPLRALSGVAGAMVTTYTYAPLVGMTSETDPKGQTTYYDYDSFQRLKTIRDQDGMILKTYCYNYAGQSTGCNVPVVTPPATVYARIEISNQQTVLFHGNPKTTGDVYVRLYSNAACTTPYTSTSALSVHVDEGNTVVIDYGSPDSSTNTATYSVPAGSSFYYLGNKTLELVTVFSTDGLGNITYDTTYTFDVSSGSGYTVSPTLIN